MSSFVAHLDADAFYVNAERVRHPDLVGKPVGVLGNQAACVIAKSYEMKAQGVKTGTPVWDARKLCPEGVYVKRDFRWYEVLSRKMLDVVGSFAQSIEYYSIDEFFFLAHPLGHRTDLARTATAIRDHVLEVAGLPVTIGIARTRTLAKLFSDTAKPFGSVAVLSREHERELLAKLPVTEISGVGGRRAARLEPYGIKTCLDLADADDRLVKRVLTKVGYELWLELNGTPVTPVRPSRPLHRVLARGGSLGGPTSDPLKLWGWAVRNLERLIEELEYHQCRAGKLTVYLSYQDAPSGGAEGRVEFPTDRFDLLLDAVRQALRAVYIPGATASHMHIIATDLSAGREQLSLFTPPNPKLDAVAKVKREANEKYGRFKVRSGATLHIPELYADPTHDFDVCDVRGKVCF